MTMKSNRCFFFVNRHYFAAKYLRDGPRDAAIRREATLVHELCNTRVCTVYRGGFSFPKIQNKMLTAYKTMESGEIQTKVTDSQEWIQKWSTEKRAIGFHKEYIHPQLEKHAPSLLAGRSNLRIFFPLCGKDWGMKWLADQGHSVIGVEVAQAALEEFFAEQQVPFTTQCVSTVDGCTLYQSEDKKIQLYCCDLFNISKDLVGQVDGVWDRGSLVAINRKDREKYVELFRSLMAPGCKYLLAALQYDETKYPGFPHNLSNEAVLELFGSFCDVEQIDDEDAFEPERHTKWGIDWLREKIFLIAPN